MGSSHALISSLVLVVSMFLLITTSFSYAQLAPKPEPAGCYLSDPQECEGKCEYRCSETHHRKPCMQYCLQCCATCLCVPPGTYGGKECCPCYNDWMTKRGTPKCP